MDSYQDGHQQYGDNYNYENGYGDRGHVRVGRGCSGRGCGGNYVTRSVQLTDGTNIDVHPAFNFSSEVWDLIPIEERNCIHDEWNEHHRCRLNNGGYSQVGNNQ
jgi:hypothetical protein